MRPQSAEDLRENVNNYLHEFLGLKRTGGVQAGSPAHYEDNKAAAMSH